MIVRITLLFLILIAFRANAISPINEVLLYPNTESSPSLYLISFTIAN